MVALAACTAAAMPTRDEIAKANQEVRKSLKAQIAAWKDGKLSDGELASLMLAHSRKFTDEARRYACLQTAFAAAVRADDAATAANALARLADEIKEFDGSAEKAILDKSLAKADDATAKSFRYRLEAERARLSSTTHVSDETAATIARMKTIVIPSLDIKKGTTLAQALRTLWELGRKYDAVETADDAKGFVIHLFGYSVMFGDQFAETIMPAEDTTPALPAVSTGAISFHDAVKTVVTAAGMDFNVQDSCISVVPQAPVLVVGAVAKPCKINIHEVRDLTLTKAIELAGGLKVPSDQCLVSIGSRSDMVSGAAVKNGRGMPRVVKLADLGKDGREKDIALRSGECVVVQDAEVLDTKDVHVLLPKLKSTAVGLLDDLSALAGDDPQFTKGEIDKAKTIYTGMLDASLRRYERESGLTRVESNASELARVFEQCCRVHGSAVWPRTVATEGPNKGNIAGSGFKSAAEYFIAQLELKNRDARQLYIRKGSDVLGKDFLVDDAIFPDKLDWCIAANVADGTPANVPVLVTANFNPALLLRKWDGKTDADKILPIGPASGASKSMFDDVAVVVVYKDYSVKRINAKELTYAAIYGKPFDATKGNPPLAYLTPTGVAEPTGKADVSGAAGRRE